MNLFVFRCRGQHQLYAATRYETGSDLPTERCVGGWEFFKVVNLSDSGTVGTDVRELGVNVRGLREGIKQHGRYVWESRREIVEPPPSGLSPRPDSVPTALPEPAALTVRPASPITLPPVVLAPVVQTPAPAPASVPAVAPAAGGARPDAVPPAAPPASAGARPTATASSPPPGAPAQAGHRVVWFDIPVRDLDRAMRFYGAVLGTPLHKEYAGPAAAIVVLPHTETTIGGCLVQSADLEPSRGGPLLYLNTDGRLDAAVAAVQANGGTLLQAKHSIGPYGFRAIVLDSEGNRIALHSR